MTATKRRKSGLKPRSDLDLVGAHLRCDQGQDPSFFVLGLDEVGVGCIAGPVVAGCFAYPVSKLEWERGAPRIKDSKQLDEEARRLAVTALTQAPGAYYAVAEASAREVDEINVLRAAQLAMERAFRDVARRLGQTGVKGRDVVVLVDGNRLPPFLQHLELAGRQTIVKGDNKSFAIAAASILAKVHRDDLMTKLAQDFPPYVWGENVGYPTPTHKLAIAQHGYTVHHRRSYQISLPDISP